MKKVTRTMMNLKKMSNQELEDIMVELRNQIEELCGWGNGQDENNPINSLVWEAQDLNLHEGYLETEYDLIKYIRKADTILMKYKTFLKINA